MNNKDKKEEFPQKGNFSASPKEKSFQQNYVQQPLSPQNKILNNDDNQLENFNKRNNFQEQKSYPSNQTNQGNKLQQNNLNRNNKINQAKQKIIKEGAKKAADATVGPVGGIAVEQLSKTKLGQTALNETSKKLQNPLKPSLFNFFKKDKEQEENIDGSGSFGADLAKKIISFFTAGTFGINGCLLVIILVAIISLSIAPLIYINKIMGNVTGSLSSIGEKIGNLLTFRGWCTDSECEEKEQNDFYEKIEESYEKYKKDPYYVTLNTNLITATLTYSDPFLTTAGDDDNASSIDTLLPSNYVNFKKSEKKVDLLATKMVSYCCYENGSEYAAPNGEHMCRGSDGKNYDDINYFCPEDVYETVTDPETGEKSEVLVIDYEEKYKLDIERYREYLENEFMLKFYYDNKQNEDTQGKIDRAVEEIFLRVSFYENFDEHKSFGKVYAYCSGVTVVDPDGSVIGTYDLEEYVAGVVSGEAWGGQNMEAYKAQAIAVRTYTLSRTQNCSQAIESSQSDQVFSEDIKDFAKEATEATEGLVLVYDDEIFSSEYDSYCYGDSNCTYGEENGKRYVIYSKKPNGETHKVYLSPEYYYMIAGGHGRGMSQVASYEMANNGSSYDEILHFFYSDGIEIVGMNTIFGGFESSSALPSSVEELKERSDYYSSLGIVSIGGQQFDLSKIYDSNASNLGQCVWYAKSRALEIILSSDMDDLTKSIALNAIMSVRANGEGWFDYPSLDIFEKSTDRNMPMPGSIISWTSDTDAGARHDYGHVAIIESVDYENRTVVMSEGWNRAGAHGASNWDNVVISTTTKTFEQLQSYGTGYTFNGYVYILGKGGSSD